MKSQEKNRRFFSPSFFPKTRKGFLLAEETLKIVLAVLAVGLLAFLLFSLYNNGKDAKDLEFAKASLGLLVEGINAEKTSIDIYNPKGWNIGIWPHDVTSGILLFKTIQFQFPKSCSNLGWQKCVCICEKNSAESCDTNGACLNTEEKFSINGGNIEISNPPITLRIDSKNKIISSA